MAHFHTLKTVLTDMLNLKEKIKHRNILRQSTDQNFENAKYIMETFSENDKFNELLAISKYSKIITSNKNILNILLEQDGDNDKELKFKKSLLTNLI